MQKFLINNLMNNIEIKKNYNTEELATIKYGLESIYILISKCIVILIIALLLGVFKEVILFLFIYNIIRSVSFGLHMNNSFICLLASIISFVGIPLLSFAIIFPLYMKIIVCASSIILIFKNAPADTYKRPLINKRRRTVFKLTSVSIAIIYSFLIFILKSHYLTNLLLFSLFLQCIIISPFTYKLFGLPYNNYTNFEGGEL